MAKIIGKPGRGDRAEPRSRKPPKADPRRAQKGRWNFITYSPTKDERAAIAKAMESDPYPLEDVAQICEDHSYTLSVKYEERNSAYRTSLTAPEGHPTNPSSTLAAYHKSVDKALATLHYATLTWYPPDEDWREIRQTSEFDW